MRVIAWNSIFFSCDWIRNITTTVECVCVRSTQIKTYSWDNAQVLLVGNKCDMEDERVVAADRGRQLSDQLGELEHCT